MYPRSASRTDYSIEYRTIDRAPLALYKRKALRTTQYPVARCSPATVPGRCQGHGHADHFRIHLRSGIELRRRPESRGRSNSADAAQHALSALCGQQALEERHVDHLCGVSDYRVMTTRWRSPLTRVDGGQSSTRSPRSRRPKKPFKK